MIINTNFKVNYCSLLVFYSKDCSVPILTYNMSFSHVENYHDVPRQSSNVLILYKNLEERVSCFYSYIKGLEINDYCNIIPNGCNSYIYQMINTKDCLNHSDQS